MVVFSELSLRALLNRSNAQKYGQQMVFWLTLWSLCNPQHAKKKESTEKHLQILVEKFRFVTYPAWSCVLWVSKNHIILWGLVSGAGFRAFEAREDHYSRSVAELDKVNSNSRIKFSRGEFEYASCQLPSVWSWQLLGIRYHKQNINLQLVKRAFYRGNLLSNDVIVYTRTRLLVVQILQILLSFITNYSTTH